MTRVVIIQYRARNAVREFRSSFESDDSQFSLIDHAPSNDQDDAASLSLEEFLKGYPDTPTSRRDAIYQYLATKYDITPIDNEEARDQGPLCWPNEAERTNESESD